MNHKCTIAGQETSIAWNNETMRRMQFRASQAGINLGNLHKDFTKPNKAAAAYTSFLWTILPQHLMRDYPTPEDLYLAIEESEVPAVHAAIFNIFNDMLPDAEKKSTSKKSPSHKSNSDSRRSNTKTSTRR